MQEGGPRVVLLNTRKPAVQQVKYDYDDFRKIQGSLAKVNTGGGVRVVELFPSRSLF